MGPFAIILLIVLIVLIAGVIWRPQILYANILAAALVATLLVLSMLR
jgi:hypothetical protein